VARFSDGKRRGPRLLARARHAVVVAASAIQTPLLLGRSGVGRRSRLVGRRFQAHPGTAVLGVFDRPVNMWFGATQGYESTHFWERRFKLESIALPLELGAVRLPGVGAELMARIADYGHIAQWAVQVRARAHGRVGRGLSGRTVIRYDPTDEDIRVLKAGVRVLTEMLFAAGAREVLPGVFGLPDRIRSVDELRPLEALPDDPRRFHCIASHLFGTAVMGPDPAASVVGLDGQAHELPGLYVADSSVFPTNLGVNPQHTICAIAWLLAERIVERAHG
jgi:choline dehydrogenase-like flavoprotein